MRIVFFVGTFLFLITNVFGVETKYIKFTNEMLVDKTFYMVEDNGYETVMKFYLQNNRLKVFYVIDYKGKLDETFTLSPTINENGFIAITVFDRPTEFRLTKITDHAYIIKEHHYHSDKHKNILTWEFEKPKDFMAKNWD